MNDRAIGHRRGLDRDHGAEWLLRQHKTTNVNRSMTRELMQSVNDIRQDTHTRIFWIEAGTREECVPINTITRCGGGIAPLFV